MPSENDKEEFNPNSFNAILGRMLQRLEQGDKGIGELRGAIEELSTAVNCLPCKTHDERLKNLEGIKARHYSFADAVKLSLLSAAAGIFCTVAGFLITQHFGG
jgi:hypothetical protein